MVMLYCGQFAKKIPYAASCKPVRMYLELKERLLHDILKDIFLPVLTRT